MSHERAPFYTCLRCAAEASYSDSPDLKARVIAGCPPHTNDERCQAPAPPLAGAAGEGEAEPVTRGRLAEIRQWVALPVIAIEGNPHFARLALIDLLAHVDKTEATAQAAFDCLKTASSDLESARARLAEETRAAAGLRVELEQRRLRNEQLIRDLLAEFAHDPSDCPAEWAMLKSFDLTAGPFDEPVKGLEPSEIAAAGPLLGDEGKEGQYVPFKSTRVYYGGLGYNWCPPTSRVVAQQMADELTAQNPVGFIVLEYREPDAK